MKRKKFIKNCMSIGIHRNAANYVAKKRNSVAAYTLGMAAARYQITNCTVVDGGAFFKMKPRGAGGGND